MSKGSPTSTSLTPPPDHAPIVLTNDAITLPGPAVVLDRSGSRPRSGDRRGTLALLGADLLAVTIAFLLGSLAASVLISSPITSLVNRPLAMLAIVGVIPFLACAGLYTRRGRAQSRMSAEFPRVATALSMFAFLALETISLTGSESATLRAGELLCIWSAALVTIPATRTTVRAARARRMSAPQQTIIVGAGAMSHNLARKLRRDPSVDLVGFVDSDPVAVPDDLADVPLLGREEDLVEIINRTQAQKLIVSFSRNNPEALVELIRNHSLHQIDIAIVPRYFDVLTADAVLDDINGIPVIDLAAGGLSRRAHIMKRMLDLVITVAMLPIIIPAFAVIALLIKVDSRGPVFFRQPRTGRRESVFNIVKFRTMRIGAEGERDTLLADNERGGPLFKMTDDPRITRVGRILRTTSLDELPQLINVLMGQMSLVGPRPFVTYEDAQITGWARQRLDLSPGVTGLWQVMGRSDITFDEMLRLDHLYVTRWSLAGDLKILLQTIPAVLLRRNS